MNSWIRAAAIALLVACPSPGSAQDDRTQAETLAQRAADRLRSLHEETERLLSDEQTLLGELRRLEIQRQIKSEELAQVERDAEQVVGDLAALDAQVATLEAQDRAETPRLREQVVGLYKLGQGGYLRLLLSTTEVEHIGQSARMVAALAAQDRARVARHQQRREELASARTALEERREQLASLRAGASRAKTEADQAVAARNARIIEIDERRDLNAQLSGELAAVQQKLQATLGGLGVAASATAPIALPIAPFRGDLEWPAEGAIRQAFGRSMTGGAAASNGIDLASPEGAVARAVHDGTVAFAGPFVGFGQLVVVDHGAQAFSLYGNLRDTAVAAGQAVASGHALGTVGVAATGVPGLYFELRVDGRPVDPLQWLRKR